MELLYFILGVLWILYLISALLGLVFFSVFFVGGVWTKDKESVRMGGRLLMWCVGWPILVFMKLPQLIRNAKDMLKE